MKHRHRGNTRGRGFTLVEIMIVVIILGILGAIVVPQFSSASSDAQAAALSSNLQTMRGQIELYKAQHNGNYPPYATFTNVMTLYSDVNHNTSATKTGAYIYGPYILAIPPNPYDSSNVVDNVDDNDGGWYYDQTTGNFRTDDGTHDTQ
ncbi:MAG: type II secretion system protein [Phycisphaerae bacterium]